MENQLNLTLNLKILSIIWQLGYFRELEVNATLCFFSVRGRIPDLRWMEVEGEEEMQGSPRTMTER